ncbi:MAG: DUF4112 domain-containing protein [Armatimonadetes bacterium]|nr:MAG: DUF4112 domain-containing protein [Armatimonadota bacterium]
MIGRIILDFSFGLIPLAGDLLDTIYQSNSKNLSVLQKYNRP